MVFSRCASALGGEGGATESASRAARRSAAPADKERHSMAAVDARGRGRRLEALNGTKGRRLDAVTKRWKTRKAAQQQAAQRHGWSAGSAHSHDGGARVAVPTKRRGRAAAGSAAGAAGAANLPAERPGAVVGAENAASPRVADVSAAATRGAAAKGSGAERRVGRRTALTITWLIEPTAATPAGGPSGRQLKGMRLSPSDAPHLCLTAPPLVVLPTGAEHDPNKAVKGKGAL